MNLQKNSLFLLLFSSFVFVCGCRKSPHTLIGNCCHLSPPYSITIDTTGGDNKISASIDLASFLTEGCYHDLDDVTLVLREYHNNHEKQNNSKYATLGNGSTIIAINLDNPGHPSCSYELFVYVQSPDSRDPNLGGYQVNGYIWKSDRISPDFW